MALKICKACGKEFDAKGTAAYCSGPHFRVCEVCGTKFECDPRSRNRCCSSKCKALMRKQSLSLHMHTCQLCGKEFSSTSLAAKYCSDVHTRPCPICGKAIIIERGKEYVADTCCSAECSREQAKQTCLQRYGVPNAAQADAVKHKLHTAAVSDTVKLKKEATCIQHWGVSNPAQHPDVRAKIARTVSSQSCQEQMQSTTMMRFGTSFAMQSEEGLRRYSATIQQKYGVPYFCMTDKCKEAQGNIVSAINRHVGDLLKAHNIPFTFEVRLDNYSYDIGINEDNILLEINPTYTHNAIGNHWRNQGLDCNYHLSKTTTALAHGYRCIHVFDWDDLSAVISLFSPKEKIYARKCSVRTITPQEARKFEMLYHLQGKCNGQQVCLGLYLDDALVEIMTFGKPRYTPAYQWELLRLCTDARYKVVGGAERLFKHFIASYSPNSIISYCDRAKFTGEVYTRLGFTLHHVTPPGKIWSKSTKKITHNLLLSRGYDQLFGTNFGKGASNESLMLRDGWLPIYDCGQAAYTWIHSDIQYMKRRAHEAIDI